MKKALLVEILVIAALSAVAVALHAQDTRMLRGQTQVYAKPDTSAVVLDVYTAGVSVEVVGSQAGWTMVRQPGSAEVGWVPSSRLVAPGSGASSMSVAAPGGLRMTTAQMSILQNRVSAMNGSLDRLEMHMDRILDRLEPKPPARMSPGQFTSVSTPEASPEMQEMEDRLIPYAPPDYRWTNRFLMGKYFQGTEDIYGLAFSRAFDRWGSLAVEFEAVYGIGNNRGQSDDLIDWGLGLRYNIMRRSYWIYPFVESTFGLRHRLGDVAAGSGPLHYNLISPGGGLTASIGDIFSLEIGSRAMLLFNNGAHRSEGRITFSTSFNF